MKLELKPFDFAQAVARAGHRVGDASATPPLGAIASPTAASTVEPSFKVSMSEALRGVSRQQLEAQQHQRDLQMDRPGASLEQTMVAMQKSQIGFQAVLSVRNRMVQAYQDIMNMQV
jgi:flagellar hook-basal body complex protein FliE